jgi:hypothetical protein
LRPLNTQQLTTLAVSFVSFISAKHLRGLAQDPWSSSEASHDTLQAVAQLCSFLFGSLAVAGDGSVAWSVVKKVMLDREGWSPVWGRVVIAWVSISDSEEGALPPCLHVLGSDAVSSPAATAASDRRGLGGHRLHCFGVTTAQAMYIPCEPPMPC